MLKLGFALFGTAFLIISCTSAPPHGEEARTTASAPLEIHCGRSVWMASENLVKGTYRGSPLSARFTGKTKHETNVNEQADDPRPMEFYTYRTEAVSVLIDPAFFTGQSIGKVMIDDHQKEQWTLEECRAR